MDYKPLEQATLADACVELAAGDRVMARLLQRNGLPPLWSRPAGFATLVQLILEQQVSLDSARATWRRLGQATGKVTPASLAAADAGTLREAGVSRQKARYLFALAGRVLAGELDLARLSRVPAEQARKTLMGELGIGAWTADVYLLMALRHPDVWPIGDVALDQAFRTHKRPRTERGSWRIINRWRPWRSVAARLLWHDYLVERDRAERGPGVDM